MSKRKHVFISHHHADDDHVTRLTRLLGRRGFEIRNSSIRAKPENQRRLDEKRVSDRTIKRLLRMKISWASTVVVLIGKDTHERPWVNWEIERANELGKRIIGVYAHGSSEADKPPALEDHATAIVGWNTDRIIAAIEGKENPFDGANGKDRAPVNSSTHSTC